MVSQADEERLELVNAFRDECAVDIDYVQVVQHFPYYRARMSIRIHIDQQDGRLADPYLKGIGERKPGF